jgi:signal transduction histidine kinase
MPLLAAGAAFVDRSGAVLAADRGFRARLGLELADADEALRVRAAASPELRALLSGDGPAVARVAGADGQVEVERVPAAGGALLVLHDPVARDEGEHALRSQVLARVLAGVAHDIKNPLNAMSLQLALLGDKLEGAADASRAAGGHLASLRDQIARVNEVLRRLVDVVDPPAPLGYTDLGALLGDLGCLFGYEVRRRRIDVAAAVRHTGTARTPCEPARLGRLVLVLYGRALASTPDGGHFEARAETRDGKAVVTIEHTTPETDGELQYDAHLLAAGAETLGGRLERTRGDHRMERFTLVVPGNE